MLKVGLTGGIGSGKSTVGRLFELLGVPLYKADDAARHIMQTNPDVRLQIIALLGADAYRGTMPDRAYISARVFEDKKMLEALNAIVHPVVVAHGEAWMLAHSAHRYIIKEAAILFESGTWRQLDFVIGVYAPLELRVLRTMQRDGSSRQSVLQRVGQQMDEEEKMSKCRYVITNDGTKAIIPQVLDLHQQILHLHSGL